MLEFVGPLDASLMWIESLAFNMDFVIALLRPMRDTTMSLDGETVTKKQS